MRFLFSAASSLFLLLSPLYADRVTVQAADVVEKEHLPTSMMPPGLVNALSLEEFPNLVAFLAEKKG